MLQTGVAAFFTILSAKCRSGSQRPLGRYSNSSVRLNVSSHPDLAQSIEQELHLARYKLLEREVTDPLAAGLLHIIIVELEADLQRACAPQQRSLADSAEGSTA
jgi:hypothetical protein